MLSSNSREAALEASISHQPHFSIYCEVRGGCERFPQADHHADNVLVMVNSRGPKLHTVHGNGQSINRVAQKSNVSDMGGIY